MFLRLSIPRACMIYDLSLFLERRYYLSSESLSVRERHPTQRARASAQTGPSVFRVEDRVDWVRLLLFFSRHFHVASSQTERPDLNTGS